MRSALLGSSSSAVWLWLASRCFPWASLWGSAGLTLGISRPQQAVKTVIAGDAGSFAEKRKRSSLN